MQTITDRRYGRKKKASEFTAELHPVKKKEKIVPRDSFTVLLWRQDSVVRLFSMLYRREEGTENMKDEQVALAMRVKENFADGVTEVFTPKQNGQRIWPYTLSETDLCKLAWAIHIGQNKIIVPRWVKI